jgi:hypothetical protein
MFLNTHGLEIQVRFVVMKSSIAVLLMYVLSSTVVPVSAQSQAANSLLGTWTLNMAKSTSSGTPMKSNTSRIEAVDGGIRLINEGTYESGQTMRVEYTVRLDGKDYPWKGVFAGKALAAVDSVAMKKIDDYTFEVTEKGKGQVVTTQRWVISKDGKTRTVTTTGINSEGRPGNRQTLVYEKQ